MKIDWQDFCRVTGFTIIDGGIEVHFDTGRSQKVTIEDHGTTLLVSSIAARHAAVRELPDGALHAWVRNRTLALVGFRVDERGRMIGESWVPKIGLTATEF